MTAQYEIKDRFLMDNAMRRVGAVLALAALSAVPAARASVVPLGCYIQFSQPVSYAMIAVAPGCVRETPWIGSQRQAARGSAWKVRSLAAPLGEHEANERRAPTDLPVESSAPGAADGAYAVPPPHVDFSGGRAALPWQSLIPLSAGGLAWVASAQSDKLTGSADPRRPHPVANPAIGHGAGGTPVPVAAGGTGGAGAAGSTTDVSVPEPSTLALFGLALMLFALNRLLPRWYPGAARWRQLFVEARRRRPLIAD